MWGTFWVYVPYILPTCEGCLYADTFVVTLGPQTHPAALGACVCHVPEYVHVSTCATACQTNSLELGLCRKGQTAV